MPTATEEKEEEEERKGGGEVYKWVGILGRFMGGWEGRIGSKRAPTVYHAQHE